MIPTGIVDPTKVTRSALQNASSVAAMVLYNRTSWLLILRKKPSSYDATRRHEWYVLSGKLSLAFRGCTHSTHLVFGAMDLLPANFINILRAEDYSSALFLL